MDTSIINLKNIGEKRQRLFNKLGIDKISDLLQYYPRHYEDRSNIKKIDELIINEDNALLGKINTEAENIFINNKTMTKLILKDNTDKIELIWFNRPYLKKVFTKGAEFIFYGNVTYRFGKIQMSNPDYELICEKEMLNTGRIVPVYPVTSGLSQKIVRSVMKDALDNFIFDFEDMIPNYIKEEEHLCDKTFAIKNIHFPETDEAFFMARNRLVFEELFLLQLSLIKLKDKKKNIVMKKKFNNISYEKLKKYLPYKLTKAQDKVVNEIINDFKNGIVMNRLVQGDVGSGKTVVALIASYIAIKNGYQASIMVPTEVLANQHYKYFKEFFSKLNIETILLTGSQKRKEKNETLDSIKIGKAKMIIGTHAIIQEGVEFDNLGIVITDEQHRFGVNQRETFIKKGINPHTMVMTATPIPRTLALILYGDLDISIIDELPPGRQKIDTFHVNTSYLERIHIFIKKEVSKGRQCYIICPTIEDTENTELKSVMSYKENLKKKFKNIKIESLHGKMKQDEKNNVMQDFKDNKIDVIVSTTVVEVGVNVPNATVMLIENAERFGLAQLHQLRGRIGRGKEKSFCVLISDTKNKHTKKRLKAMVDSNDGFYISELDLLIRGSGDFFGTRQHGLPELKIANLYKDMEILKSVQNIIKNFNYSKVSQEEKIILTKYLTNYFEKEQILL